MILLPLKIVSGGQTGVDRAALDFAMKQGISCSGWCPKGRKAENGPIPATYPLNETNSAEYPERTKLNIDDSDGTLIITRNRFFDRGTALTHTLCKKYGKPCLVIDLSRSHGPQIERLNAWIRTRKIHTLNIAGPRESALPMIYQETMLFLDEAGKQE